MSYIEKCIDAYCRKHDQSPISVNEFLRLKMCEESRPAWIDACYEYIVVQKTCDRVDAYHDKVGIPRRERAEVESAIETSMRGGARVEWMTADMVAFVTESVDDLWD